jgi:hypothetical protein
MPGVDTLAAMKRLALVVALLVGVHCDKREPVPAGPESTVAPKPPIPANASNDRRPTPQPRAQALAGIAAYRNLIRRRMAVGAQSGEACQRRRNSEESEYDAAKQKLGDYWLSRKTRYSSKAPDIGADVETFVALCSFCTSPDQDEAPDECKQALVALDDLESEINAAK